MSSSTLSKQASTASDACVAALKQLLAESYQLFVKTHGYHWNVVGPQFVELHKLFEEQYNDLFEAVDEIAERVRALGAKAPPSFSAFTRITKLDEGQPDTPAKEMIANLLHDNEQVASTCRRGIAMAEEAEDAASADLFTERQAKHDKAAWMLRSLLE